MFLDVPSGHGVEALAGRLDPHPPGVPRPRVRPRDSGALIQFEVSSDVDWSAAGIQRVADTLRQCREFLGEVLSSAGAEAQDAPSARVSLVGDVSGAAFRLRPGDNLLFEVLRTTGLGFRLEAMLEAKVGAPRDFKYSCSARQHGRALARVEVASRRLASAISTLTNSLIHAVGAENLDELVFHVVSGSGQVGFDFEPAIVSVVSNYRLEIVGSSSAPCAGDDR